MIEKENCPECGFKGSTTSVSRREHRRFHDRQLYGRVVDPKLNLGAPIGSVPNGQIYAVPRIMNSSALRFAASVAAQRSQELPFSPPSDNIYILKDWPYLAVVEGRAVGMLTLGVPRVTGVARVNPEGTLDYSAFTRNTATTAVTYAWTLQGIRRSGIASALARAAARHIGLPSPGELAYYQPFTREGLAWIRGLVGDEFLCGFNPGWENASPVTGV